MLTALINFSLNTFDKHYEDNGVAAIVPLFLNSVIFVLIMFMTGCAVRV